MYRGLDKRTLPALAFYAFLSCSQPPPAVNTPAVSVPEEAEGIEYVVAGTPRRAGDNLVEMTLLRPGKRHAAEISVSYCVGEDEARRRDLGSILAFKDGQKVRLRSAPEHGANICSGTFF